MAGSGRCTDVPISRICSTTLVLSAIRKLKILIVDDTQINRKVLRKRLPSYVEVVEAEDGSDAVSKVINADDNNLPFDLIFMDLSMPNMDGRTAVNEIRTKNKEVAIYCYSSEISTQAAYNLASIRGMNGFLAKPFDQSDLLSIINMHIGPRKEEAKKEIFAATEQKPSPATPEAEQKASAEAKREEVHVPPAEKGKSSQLAENKVTGCRDSLFGLFDSDSPVGSPIISSMGLAHGFPDAEAGVGADALKTFESVPPTLSLAMAS